MPDRSPSFFSPNPCSTPLKNLASGRSSSSSLSWASAWPIPPAMISIAANELASARRRMAWRQSVRICQWVMAVPRLAIDAKNLAALWIFGPACIYYHGSGRFCGIPPEERLVKQPDHARNNTDVGKVKDVPAERPRFRRDVEQHEVNHGPVGDAVDPVADRAADDQSERERGEARAGAREPDPQQYHRHRLDGEQRPLAEWAELGQQAEADPGVPREHQIDERADMDRNLGGQIEDEQEPNLRRLIDHGGQDRDH